MSSPPPLTEADEQRFWLGVEAAGRFFMGEADVQEALEKLVRTLDEQRIPYAIVGAMALNEFGYRWTTVDVDVLLTAEGLQAFKKNSLGRGYAEKFPGSSGIRDTEHGVDIDIRIAFGISLTFRKSSGSSSCRRISPISSIPPCGTSISTFGARCRTSTSTESENVGLSSIGSDRDYRAIAAIQRPRSSHGPTVRSRN
jgi:hypothetical protein